MEHLPLLIVIIPLGTAFMIALGDLAYPRSKVWILVTGLGLQTAAVCLLGRAVARQGLVIYVPGGWLPPWGILLAADAGTVLLAGIVLAGFIAVTIFSLGSRELGALTGKFFPLLCLYTSALNGIVVAADLFNLFVFLELATVSTIGLIGMKGRGRNAAAALTYLILASFSGVLFLLAVIVIYRTTGTLSIPLAARVIPSLAGRTRAVLAVSLVVSLGIKIGLVPLHLWQAPAYRAAGSTAAGFLSAVGMKVYLGALIRLLWGLLQAPLLVPALFPVLLWAGMINIVLGHLLALFEGDLKRLIAFSSVAHAGYICLGLGAAGMAGVSLGDAALATTSAAGAALAAALYHAVNHSAMKSALFWSCRSFIVTAGTSRIASLSGRAAASPLAFAAFLGAAAALIGLPPTGGFASKWQIAIVQPGVLPLLVIALGTVISLVYYARTALILAGPGTLAGPLEDTTLPEQGRADSSGQGIGAPETGAPGTRAPGTTVAAVLVLLLAGGALSTGILERWMIPFLEEASQAFLSTAPELEAALEAALDATRSTAERSLP
ncbi:multicomponent Na+:H+ antiporter subunit D [Alkalispirochaeta americana]|uniref:Multicomponent Na+:H+ antiporter subunit D n=1 Tax=Alkalispirochaeta americana TaxID=159291 RepID=A0A1N6TFP7_9SPIO|nr:proton-conducting transporter membrane subunit [Alkalispirochaeta americana]SIQ52091.1 multicomponent Na+:H+ antiporter subunit D [Alkalispirochaeta americana]